MRKFMVLVLLILGGLASAQKIAPYYNSVTKCQYDVSYYGHFYDNTAAERELDLMDSDMVVAMANKLFTWTRWKSCAPQTNKKFDEANYDKVFDHFNPHVGDAFTMVCLRDDHLYFYIIYFNGETRDKWKYQTRLIEAKAY